MLSIFLRNPFLVNLDGLYVLLKKNKKQGDRVEITQPPSHLKYLLIEEDLPETCPWSLSGPQFPTPTTIQQRYCYPKGRPEYSSRKGGALWTMYGADGKEDVEYRLLHVYYSAKRAHNMGAGDAPDGSPPQLLELGVTSRKRSPTSLPRRSHPKRRLILLPDEEMTHHSPEIIHRCATSPSTCHSPTSVENLPRRPIPKVPRKGSRHSHRSDRSSSEEVCPLWAEQLIVTPINDIVEQRQSRGELRPPPFDRQILYQEYLSEDNKSMVEGPVPSPLRGHNNASISTINVTTSPVFRTGEYSVEMPWDEASISTSDSFDLDFPLQNEIDDFWNDPLTSVMMNEDNVEDRHSPAHLFALKLESLQDIVRERILSAPISEQPKLVNVMATWARKMALDPLAVTTATMTPS